MTHINRSERPSFGIPKVLRNIHYEKISEVVPVKVQLSLKNCLKQLAGNQGVSTWIRELILEKLESMTEEAEERARVEEARPSMKGDF